MPATPTNHPEYTRNARHGTCPVVGFLPAAPGYWSGWTRDGKSAVVQPVIAWAQVRHTGACIYCLESGGRYGDGLELVPVLLEENGTTALHHSEHPGNLGVWYGQDDSLPDQVRYGALRAAKRRLAGAA